ncbi:MAG: ROK family transcriptional regulator [Limnochordales bacterium]|nr:ROK family transcriptional regulator [Limnochordales bacterium]
MAGTAEQRWTGRHKRLFQLIASRPGWTRQQLAEATGWSGAAVWQVSKDLIEAGFVAAEGQGPSRGGRRPTLLTLAGDKYLLAVVRVHGNRLLEARWLTANGRLLQGLPAQISRWEEGSDLVACLAELVQAGMRRLPADLTPVGVALILPGLVDRGGRLLFSSPLGLKDFPVSRALGDRLGLPVVAGNDVDLAALAESRWGKGRDARRLIYLWVDQGIGVGLVFDGRLYLGSHTSAGELGHFTVDPSGALCRCGNRGCLGVTASEPGLIGQASRLIWVDQQNELRRLTGGDLNRLSLQQVARAVGAGDPLARQMVDQALDHLGLALANLVNLLGPDLILVSGSVYEMDPRLVMGRLQAAVTNHSLPVFREAVRLEAAALGEEGRFMGGVALFREVACAALWAKVTGGSARETDLRSGATREGATEWTSTRGMAKAGGWTDPAAGGDW